MVDEVIRHHPPGFGQLVLPLVQQLPEISRHVSFLSYFFPGIHVCSAAHTAVTPLPGLFLNESIKESFLLGKSGFHHKSPSFSVQSVQFQPESTTYFRKFFSKSDKNVPFVFENFFQAM